MTQSRIELTAVDKTAAAFSSARGGLQALGRQVLNVKTLLVGLAGGAGFGFLIKKSFEAVDANAKLADRLGITTEKLAGLRHAADLAGVSENSIVTATRMLSQNLADAARGTGEAALAFNALRINAQELLRLPMDQQLNIILDRLAGMENATLRNAYAADIFGGRAAEMLNLIADGSAGIRKATEDSIAWGLALDRVDSAKIEQANDAVTRAQGAMSGVANIISVELSPVITALANQFADAAAKNNGFRDQVVNGMENVAIAIGYVANVLTGLQWVIWSGIKLAAGAAIDFIIQGVANLDRVLTTLANKFSGSFIGQKLGLEASTYNEALQLMADVSRERLGELKTEFDRIATEGLPAEKIQEWFAKVRQAAQETAEQTAAAREKLAGTGSVLGLDDAKAAEEFAKYEERLAQKIQKLSESFTSAREMLAQHLTANQMMIEESWVLGQITTEERNRLEQELMLQHQAKLGDIHAQGVLERRKFEELNALQQMENVFGTLQQLTQGVAAHNRKMFQLNKIAGIANAIINAYKGISMSLSAYPMPLAAVMAAAHAAAAFAQVRAISSAKFGSSTSAPSVGGGGAIPVTPVQGPPSGFTVATDQRSQQPQQPMVQIIVNGNIVDTGQFWDEHLEDIVKDRLNRRDSVLFDANSRQARELLPA